MTDTKNANVLGNCFVTGATGLLGVELVSQLHASGEARRIVCLVRDHLPHGRFFTSKLNDKVIVVQGDVRDAALLDRVLNEYEIETVFHLAAQTLVGQANTRPVDTLDVNVRGTWNLLEAVRNNPKRVKATIFASSDKAYGNLHGESYNESYALKGEHPYDVSKSAADLICQAYAHSYKMNVSITRCGNFFGPGDLNENRIFPSVIMAHLRKEAPVIRSDGKFIRDYIYVADGAAAYRTLARAMHHKPLPGEAFNFSYGLRLSVLDVVEAVGKAMDAKTPPVILNQASNEIPVQCLDSTKAREVLSWKPEFGFEHGVSATVGWYREQFGSGVLR